MKMKGYDPIRDLEAKTAEQNRRADQAKAAAQKGMKPQKVGFFYRLWHFLGCLITIGIIVTVIALVAIYGYPALLALFGG